MTKEVREKVWSQKVIDYIIKDDPNGLDYVVAAIKRLEENVNSTILVVDDSSVFRKMFSNLLTIHQFKVITARNGQKALEIIEKHKDIQLIITDYNMPVMDGFTLCQEVRKNWKKEDLAIIGVSASEDKTLAARFIKNGANDFLFKDSFIWEEFYCRVGQTIDNVKLFKKTKDAATIDFLTGLYNRRYFFDTGTKLFSDFKKASSENVGIACAMIDIDHFKKVNDTYGHDVGDIVIKKIALTARNIMINADQSIVARLGGEEFCILFTNKDLLEYCSVFNYLKKAIENTKIKFNDDKDYLKVTISIGVCIEKSERLEDMVNKADELLYQAKNQGRNQVVIGKV